ncbi:MAG: methyltransferase [Methylophilaceae bacterium]|uniref:methyltransferase n=1 Tax=Methylovorus sp. MM2 TaxID=1848038 RepID=UPI0007DFA027|nr:class I SAM-dependent methyltransferase [Methylovorus sp. MM2]OAM51994.1 methylase [Methylovorus sp. MM2]
MSSDLTKYESISWVENNRQHAARWRSENGTAVPKRVEVIDDTMTADIAYRLACEGTALLWRGDFQNARQLLQAMARRIESKPRKSKQAKVVSITETFHLHRQAQAQRARTLGMLLVEVGVQHVINLRRAPDIREAAEQLFGAGDKHYVISLRELLGIIGAYEWRKKGVDIPALGDRRIHPHYGVFSPVRGEYVNLVAETPLPSMELAFDIGTGSGILAAVLASRGVKRVIATDQDTRALNCARENIKTLGFKNVEIANVDMFPEGRAPLVVCNPPWIPAKPSSPIEYAIYDPDSRMLKNFLNGLAAHLTPKGEGWLILSDIAEHLGLRTRDQLLQYFNEAGLEVIAKIDTRPHHPKVMDKDDPLHKARAAEVTSLWRLAAIKK